MHTLGDVRATGRVEDGEYFPRIERPVVHILRHGLVEERGDVIEAPHLAYGEQCLRR